MLPWGMVLGMTRVVLTRTRTRPVIFRIQRRNTIKPEITRVRDHRRDVQIIQGGSKRRESVLYTSERGHADASSRGNGNHQNDFCRRASVFRAARAVEPLASRLHGSRASFTAEGDLTLQGELTARWASEVSPRRGVQSGALDTNGKSNRGRSSHELLRGSTGAAGRLVTSPSSD